MKKKIIENVIVILLVILILLINFSLIVEAKINPLDIVQIQIDHKCETLLEYNENGIWKDKEIVYTYCIEKESQIKYPAFCIDSSEYIGEENEIYTAEVLLNKNEQIQRILEKGYMNYSYKDWNLDCDDDLYSATKLAIHCIEYRKEPIEKYRVIQDKNKITRARKVLEVAQILYEYGIDKTQTIEEQEIKIVNEGDIKLEEINNISYYVQNCKIESNRYIPSYKVNIENFPEETKIFDIKNKEKNTFNDLVFKIAVPKEKVKDDINGIIKIENEKIKENSIFYCITYSKETQDYFFYEQTYETLQTVLELETKIEKSTLQIKKIDKETKEPIENVKFEIKDENKNILDRVTTNKDGIAILNNLNPQIVYIKEIDVPDGYIISDEEKNINLEYGRTSYITFENERIVVPKEKEIELPKLPRTGF